jgi:exodeoxyribonuclease VII large subunit
VPVVSGVGHETDVTIADLAADHRAATPSAAAETVAPSCGQLRGELDARERRLRESLRREVGHKRERAQRRFSRLDSLSPALRVVRMRQDLQARDVRLRGALVTGVSRRQRELERARGALAVHSPLRALPMHRERLAARSARLAGDIRTVVVSRRRHLEGVNGCLDALSPLRVIDRGYSITVDAATGRVVTAAAEVGPGSVLRTRLARGSVISEVLPDGAAEERERMYDVGPGQRATSEDDHG